MENILEFIKHFSLKSRHHNKLINFLFPELKKISKANILEFGVSEKAMSTELFLKYSELNQCKVFSVDNVNYKSKFSNQNWRFILSRDDDYKQVEKFIPNEFSLILLDTVHEAKHVENIIYNYFDKLKLDSCFFIDDINWMPYLKKSEKNRFYNEINNYETFEKLLEIYYANRTNISLDFTFHGTGMCKIKKIKQQELNPPQKIYTRKNSIKNFLRKIFI